MVVAADYYTVMLFTVSVLPGGVRSQRPTVTSRSGTCTGRQLFDRRSFHSCFGCRRRASRVWTTSLPIMCTAGNMKFFLLCVASLFLDITPGLIWSVGSGAPLTWSRSALAVADTVSCGYGGAVAAPPTTASTIVLSPLSSTCTGAKITCRRHCLSASGARWHGVNGYRPAPEPMEITAGAKIAIVGSGCPSRCPTMALRGGIAWHHSRRCWLFPPVLQERFSKVDVVDGLTNAVMRVTGQRRRCCSRTRSCTECLPFMVIQLLNQQWFVYCCIDEFLWTYCGLCVRGYAGALSWYLGIAACYSGLSHAGTEACFFCGICCPGSPCSLARARAVLAV